MLGKDPLSISNEDDNLGARIIYNHILKRINLHFALEKKLSNYMIDRDIKKCRIKNTKKKLNELRRPKIVMIEQMA